MLQLGRARSARFGNLEEARTAARRRLPRVAFDYIDGGADDERTLSLNRQAFADAEFVPQFLGADAPGDLQVEVAGTPLDFPVAIAPTGLAGIVRPDADVVGARAAAAENALFICATLANSALEEVAAAPPGPRWFQLYAWDERDAVEALIARAARAKFAALVVTIDTPDLGNRERDRRNGFGLPPRISSRTAYDVVRHAGWTRSMLAGFDFPNLRAPDGSAPRGLRASLKAANTANERLYECAVSANDLSWIRERWSGPLVVKGVLSVSDAQIAADRGADAIVVSNHGGRQLDGSVASLTALAAIAPAVGHEVDILLDGGVRRGSDVVKALALGAKACLIGRPWLFGLAADGEDGVRRVLQILREETRRTLELLGAGDVAALSTQDQRPSAG